MLQLLIRLEYKRQDFIRSKLMLNFVNSATAYFGIAGLIFFIALFPMLISPPVAVAEAPPEAVVVGGLILVGFLMCATVVLAPVGLVLL